MTLTIAARLLHIVAGLLALTAGAVTLGARKGGGWHRRSGTAFVYAMLAMSASGTGLAALKSDGASVAGGLLTFYLVATALLTLRPRILWVDIGAMLFGVMTGVFCLQFALGGMNPPADGGGGGGGGGGGESLTGPAFVFGVVALLAAWGDARMIRSRGVAGARRIARHLWRMCFALLIATASFFLGQAQVFPKPLRIVPLLATPVLLVLAVMAYWLVRVRFAGQWSGRGGRVSGATPVGARGRDNG